MAPALCLSLFSPFTSSLSFSLSFPPFLCLYTYIFFFSSPLVSSCCLSIFFSPFPLSPLFSSFFLIVSFSFLFLIHRSLTRLFPFVRIRFKSRRRANGRNARNRIGPSLVRRTFARAVSRPRRATRDPAICFPSIDSERFSIYDRPNVIYPACSFRLARIHTCRTVETVRRNRRQLALYPRRAIFHRLTNSISLQNRDVSFR